MKKYVILWLLCAVAAVVCALGLGACNTDVTDGAGGSSAEVRFIVNGQIYKTITTDNSGNIDIPAEPDVDGYAFNGWYLDNGEWEKPLVDGSFLFYDDISVFAKMDAKTYTVTYNSGGGMHENPTSYTIESPTINLTDAVKEGYTFDGWYGDDTYTEKITAIAYGSYGDFLLYAKFIRNSYTIFFDGDGGSAVGSITQSYGTEITAPAKPDKTGYIFCGWYEVGSDTEYNFTSMPAKNLSLVARWSPVTYSISYAEAKGAENNNPPSYTIESGRIVLLDIEATGYTFSGWYIGEKKIEEILAGSVGDIVLTARWAVNGYKITYRNAEGATNDNPATYDVEGGAFLLLAPTKTGYTFGGWYADSEYKTAVTEIAAGTAGDIVLFAKWALNVYTATFMADGEVVDIKTFTVENPKVEEPAIPDKNGYTKAWGSYTLSACDITITAAYAPVNYTISYENTREAANGNPTVYTVESKDIALSDISSAGYEFAGWYMGESKITEIAAGSTGDIKLCAGWSPITYAISYRETKGAKNYNPVSYTIESDKIIFSDIEAAGYTFSGWYAGDKKIEEISSGGTGDIVLTAKWAAVRYAITYNYNGDVAETAEGAALKTAYTTEDGFLLTPLVSKKSGYAFDGWYDGERKVGEIPKGSTGDISLTAKWSPIVYTISYSDTMGAANVNPFFYTVESGGITFSDIKAEDYTFLGWYIGDKKIEKILAGTVGNLALTAKWTEFNLSDIEYDESKTAIRANDIICAELFGASCLDTDGNAAKISLETEGSQAAGKTVDVRITATSRGKSKSLSFGVRVYGAPKLTLTKGDKSYINVGEDFSANDWGASGVDSFGGDVFLKAVIDGEYAAGKLVAVVISATDIVGNVTEKRIENIKVYDMPEIFFEGGKEVMSIRDTICAELFGATARDSFGEAIAVTAKKTKGEITAGGTVTVAFTATDCADNETSVVKAVKVYGAPKMTEAATAEFKEEDEITPAAFGVSATDSFGEKLFVTLTLEKGEKVGGETVSYTATAKDIAGNVLTKSLFARIYGAPAITYEREALNASDIVTEKLLNVVAKDSFGASLTATVALKSGELAGGKTVIYSITATDKLGNRTSVDTEEIRVYDANDICLTYNKNNDKIKLASRGEEFAAKASDSFKEDCAISFELIGGSSFKGGEKINLYIVATDGAGNSVKSELIENVKVYDIPTATYCNEAYYMYATDDINSLWKVEDSFGERVEYTATKSEVKDNLCIVSFVASDVAGNEIEINQRLAYLSEGVSLLALYVNGDCYGERFVASGEKFTLPAVAGEEGNYVWKCNGEEITDENGESLDVWAGQSGYYRVETAISVKPYAITYNLNGGTNSPSNPASYTVETLGGVNGKIVLQDPVKEITSDGYVSQGGGKFGIATDIYAFEGWYSEDSFENEITEITFGMGDVTLYAKWSGEKTENIEIVRAYTRVNEYGEEDEEGYYLLFGSYPQSEVTDSSLCATLSINANGTGALPTSANANGWTDYGYYTGGEVASYMWHIDTTYESEKYRGVYFISCRPVGTDADDSSGDTWQADNGYFINTVYWFKYEPLMWTILTESDGTAMLLAENIIDSREYYRNKDKRTIKNSTVYANNYMYSDVREWLNGAFYETAFSDLQKRIIAVTTVDNGSAQMIGVGEKSSAISKYACGDTEDKLFLLSEKEATTEEYDFAKYNEGDVARQKKPTEYAKCQGAYSNEELSGYGYWWLRSPANGDNADVRGVNDEGIANDANYANCTDQGIVPALNILL